MTGENYAAARTLDIQNFADAIHAIRVDLEEMYDTDGDEWQGSEEGRAVFDALTSLEAAVNRLRS